MVNKKRLLAAFLLIVLLVAPLVNAITTTVKASVWDGKHHINIAIDNGDMHVWSIEPSSGTASLLVIPSNLYLHAASYGEYKASSVGKLSLLEKNDVSLVTTAISQTLGVPIDGAFVRRDNTSGQTFDIKETAGILGLLKTVLGNKIGNRRTNLTGYDLIRLWFVVSTIKPATTESVAVSGDRFGVEKFLLPDKTEGLRIDRERFSRVAPTYFLDKTIVSENATIEVFNGTNIPGLANDFAFLVTNIGGKVINTGKSQELKEETTVFTKTKSYTAEKLARLAKGKLVFSVPGASRADIQIVLGGNK